MKPVLVVTFVLMFFTSLVVGQSEDLTAKYDKYLALWPNESFRNFLKLTHCKRISFLQQNFGTHKKRMDFPDGKMYFFIGVVEKESKIKSSCEVGIWGYSYKSQRLFLADIKKWQNYFGCQ